jgi:hypothetical protein
MKPGETLIQMARRHVSEAEMHVQKQHGIIARLNTSGLPADQAQELLHEFEATLEDHRASLARIEEGRLIGVRDATGALSVQMSFGGITSKAVIAVSPERRRWLVKS